MLNQILQKRIQKELMDLERDPPPGITCYPKEDNITELEAYIKGPPDSPYEKGLFKLAIQIPDRYPFEPPHIKFITKIHHPNIDDTGRICADILKTGEHGSWKPAINLSTALVSLQQLMAAPNPDDPLDADIAKEYQLDFPSFLQNAKEFTRKYANEETVLNDQGEDEDVDKMENTAKKEEKVKLEDDEKEDLKVKEEQAQKPKLGLSLTRKKGVISSQSTSSQANSKIEMHSPMSESLSVKRTIKTEMKVEKAAKIEKIKAEESLSSVDDVQSVEKKEKKLKKKANNVHKSEKVDELKIEEKIKRVEKKVKSVVKKEEKMELDDNFKSVDDPKLAAGKKAEMEEDEPQLESCEYVDMSSQESARKRCIEDVEGEVSSQKVLKRKKAESDDEGEETRIKKEQQHQNVSMVNLSSQKLKLLSAQTSSSQQSQLQTKESNKILPNRATETSAYFNSQNTSISIDSDRDEDMPLLMTQKKEEEKIFVRDVTKKTSSTITSTSSSSFINQEVIHLLSDSEDDNDDQQGKFLLSGSGHNSNSSIQQQPTRFIHNLQLSKKLQRNKLSLSKKKKK